MYIIEIKINDVDSLYYKHADREFNQITISKYVYSGLTNFKMLSAIKRHKSRIDSILEQDKFTIYCNAPYAYIRIKNPNVSIPTGLGLESTSCNISNFKIESIILEVNNLNYINFNFDNMFHKNIKFHKRNTQTFCTMCGLGIGGIPYVAKLNICAFCIQKLGQEAEVEINNHYSKEEIIEIKKQRLIQTIGG